MRLAAECRVEACFIFFRSQVLNERKTCFHALLPSNLRISKITQAFALAISLPFSLVRARYRKALRIKVLHCLFVMLG